MKIAIDARLWGLENTGLGRYTMNLISELSLIDNENEYYILLKDKYFNTLNFPENWKKVPADFRHYTIKEQIKLPQILNAIDPDVTHFPHLNVPLAYKRKFVVTIHDLIMHKQGRNATTLPLPLYYAKRIPFKIIARHAALASKVIITPSLSVKNEVKNYYKISEDKISVTYEGLKWNGQRNNKGVKHIQINNKYFLYVGNVYPHKNIKRLIQAVKNLNEKSGFSADLVIVCSRDIFYERIKAFSENIGAKQYIKSLGYVDDKDLKEIYKKAEAFVYPSLSEGFGLQGLEAISAGTVVLASDIPVFREIYKNYVLFFNPTNIKSIEDVLIKTLEMDKYSREKIIKESLSLLDKYSWRKMARETLKVYDMVYKMQ